MASTQAAPLAMATARTAARAILVLAALLMATPARVAADLVILEGERKVRGWQRGVMGRPVAGPAVWARCGGRAAGGKGTRYPKHRSLG